MADLSPLTIVLDRLLERHGLGPDVALRVLARAAARKDTTIEALTGRIVRGGTPDPLAEARAEVAHLRTALASRDVIGQAKGILMERHGIDDEEAFARLVSMSQTTNVKVREVCEYLVELRTDDPTPRPEIDFRAT